MYRRLYCIGGKDAHGRRLNTVEAMDPREGRWESVASLATARSSFGVTCLDGRVYVFAGNDDKADLVATAEAYCPLMNSWQMCAPVPFASSGLAACPI